MDTKPEIGKAVWYHPVRAGRILKALDKPCVATVAFVHEDGLVNLGVIDHFGDVRSAQRVPFGKPEGDGPAKHWWEWPKQAEPAPAVKPAARSQHA